MTAASGFANTAFVVARAIYAVVDDVGKTCGGDVIQHLAAIAFGLLLDLTNLEGTLSNSMPKDSSCHYFAFVIPRFNARKHVFICGCLACFFLYSYFVDTGLSIVAKIRSKNFVIKQNTVFRVWK
jgi:hypothetical protein